MPLALISIKRHSVPAGVFCGHRLEEAVNQSTQIGAVNRWLRGQPAETVTAAVASIRKSLAEHLDGANVRLPGACGWSAAWTPEHAPAG